MVFSSKTKRIALWSGVGIVMIGSVVGMAYMATNSSSSFQTAALVNPQVSHEWFKGSANAKVTLVEYSDFQCPACAAYYPLVKQLGSELGDKIKITYRFFPLRRIHQNADASASAALAAGLQGKFWEMHNMIFDNQKKWEQDSHAEDVFIGYAKALSLDTDKFKNDMHAKSTSDEIEADYQSGISSQVEGTPTFFLNGKKIQNPQSYDEFKKLITDATANAS